MAEEDFQRLLEASAKIAEAVKAYPSDLQAKAYEDLMGAFRGIGPQMPSANEARVTSNTIGSGPSGDAGNTSNKETADGGRRRKAGKAATSRKGRSGQVAAERDINFWPEGRVSFPDFVAEKQPVSNDQRNLLAVYWFEQVAGEDAVSTGHVLAAYKTAK
jgi:hypothetical protein